MKKSKTSLGNTLITHIKARLDELGLTVYSATKKYGLNNDALRNVLEGREPRLSTLESICSALDIPFNIGAPEKPTSSPDYDDLVMIPQSDVTFSAGHGATPPDDETTIKGRVFSRKWLESRGLDIKQLELVRIKGESMVPDLYPGDIVMIDRRVSTPIATKPIAFRLQGDLFIKNCQPVGDGRLEMFSSNSLFRAIVIDPARPPADFQIIGAVVWSAHVWD